MTDQARRDVLIGGAAVVIASTISTNPRGASAQQAGSIGASEWDYRSGYARGDGRADGRYGSIATGAGQQRVRPCPLCPQSRR